MDEVIVNEEIVRSKGNLNIRRTYVNNIHSIICR